MPITTVLPLALVLTTLPPHQEGASSFPEGRYGEYLRTYEELRGPVDALALPDGTLLVVEQDADRLTRIAADGRREAFGPGDLDSPRAVVALPAGGYAVADTGGDRVLILDAEGALVRSFGGRGTLRAPLGLAARADRVYVAGGWSGSVEVYDLEGKRRSSLTGLVYPVALALDDDGLAYVVDAGAHAVVVFGPDGKRVRSWGEFGPYTGLLGHPSDVEVRDGRVYVSDADNHRIQVFTTQGAPVYEWGKHALRPREGEGSLHYPSGIELWSGGSGGNGSEVFVCERLQDRVQVFGPTERDPAAFMTDPGLLPWKVAPHYGTELTSVGELLVLFEPETQNVLICDLELEEPVEINRSGTYGDAPGQFREIADVLLEQPNEDGGPWTVFVTDRVQGTLTTIELDHDPAEPVKIKPRMASFARRVRIGGKGADAVRPGALVRAWRDLLAVVDERRGAVLLITLNGEILGLIDGFDEPVDLAFGDQELYVTDRGAREIVVVGEDGSRRRTLSGFDRPHGVALSPTGRLFATDAGSHTIHVFDEQGQPLRTFGDQGLGASEFYRPRGLTFDHAGRLIVVDHGNHRGQIFDPDGEFVLAFGPRGYTRPTRVESGDR